ncbi:matrix protein [Colocasia bobone disease-associated virus]|uniref:Matrix protein n=1 Tax=Colocasia bobone disease-associated virus TaxID=1775456 RepID=A0A0U3FMI9_9RHAB|nr:matrix protein [Colocasia bobone disease-associated virus]ALU34426.1 matrix protein [Colocasia bobone disease-associated virus]WMX25346.1 matrix protein [Colocasia bobone disease-associated virus]
MSLKFLFVMLDVEIKTEMAGSLKPSRVDEACFTDLLKKAEIPEKEVGMITKLLVWYLNSDATRDNYHIEETSGPTLDFNSAITHEYKLPSYVLVRYIGPDFPEQGIEKISGRSEYLQGGNIIGSCSIKINNLKIKEVSRSVAEAMFRKNQSYLIRETFDLTAPSTSKKKT